MTVTELELKLGAEQYLPQLKAEIGLWNTLQGARKRAISSPSHITTYRRILERSIDRLKAEAGYSSLEQEAKESEAYRLWAHDLVAGLKDIEATRGTDFHPWLERWYPRSYAVYVDAFVASLQSPSPAKLERLKSALLALVNIYRDPPPTEVTKAAA